MRGLRFKRPSDTWDAAPEAWSPWAAASSDFVPAMPCLAPCRVSEAEYVCAPESSLLPKPARMAFEQVAALPPAGARPRITKGK